MAEAEQNFEVFSGRAASVVFTVRDDGVTPNDISSVSDIIWTARLTPASPAVLTKQMSVGGGIEFVTDGTDGAFRVNLSNTDAVGLTGFYFHEAVLVDGSGNETSVASGRVQIGPGPAWTYSGDPASSDKDAVRYLIGDTDPTAPLVKDPEILFSLTQRGSTYGAAALICRSLATGFSRLADTGDRDMRTNLSQKAASFRAMAKDYESQASETSALVFVAGVPSFYMN